MGVIFSEHDAERIRKCVHSFERKQFAGRGPNRRSYNYDDDESPLYSIRNNSTQTIAAGVSATITLDTQINKYPNDTTVFDISSSIITIKRAGVYRFSYFVSIVSETIIIGGGTWNNLLVLDRNSGTRVPGSEVYIIAVGNGAVVADGTRSIEEVVAANDTFRLRLTNNASTNGITVQGDLYTPARIDICWVREA